MSKITVTLNDELLEGLDVTSETTLAEAIALAQSSLSESEVINQIIIDKEHCDLATSEELETLPLGQISALVFKTQNIAEITQEGLEDLGDAIKHCETKFATSARSFRLGQVSDAGGDFLEGANLLQDVLRFFNAVGHQRGLTPQDPIQLRFHHQEEVMVQTFQEMEKAQLASDWNLLADLIQYELTPICSEFRDIRTSLIEVT